MNSVQIFYIVTMLCSAVYGLGTLLANFLLFGKIGEKRWKGLVPILNDYVLFRHFWTVKAYAAYLITYLIFFASARISAWPAVIVALLVSIVLLIFVIREMDIISQAFGKGMGYTIGLTWFYPVFGIILAVNKELKEKKEKEEEV